ncbi:MAG: hypothetical protein A3C85_03185 [Candidatus Doudnabacteria bacterium RIFCSPHIGHO2_02_FULL_48_21]|uniref:Zinc finger DksA/TraR C4-type domain-containing protein n=1 Tax=Candidatus Doudnabacteria bacterium RIFCSPLOWO2_02_FULL_48_13 TaxID=1817845 RepID=A0A1F5QD46_9BACT|nr:MAG: hypothetical protein A3K05_02365 [Candidatus Doudnabacteria bacterium RIFCSPHIGHO2_01_48_18]OGE80061.1 MAG: hypothetical protein A2668_04020 [Candidatus Doudnabacteria bacterium RIFCSPHIGHO2_01_FULL_48_180]OGE91277.1 MAG: hypothetical protein A3F44_04615 [Candidatus Doudnabacteria bacterium RIFCSPHIGHO2_12_FULL_47_25]OGE93532.1 MAG: hypothetical protein A3C85_03185 [Candidatus Doudnabacteria bacterium RIFCSPHIGHO2_02_FULL_48_21]OGE96308.1 MAG: hypothetical protein A3A83_01900 [Candidatu
MAKKSLGERFKTRLIEEHGKMLAVINRNRVAEGELELDGTEDEGDISTFSHSKEVLHGLLESDFQKFLAIREALQRIEQGDYGICIECDEHIHEKRLVAVPWAALCIGCQEKAENESSDHQSARPVMATALSGEGEEE